MRDLDFSPLFRNTIGFDRMARLMDNIASEGAGTSYPPYNIEQLDQDSYQISMAVAGFSDDELDIEVLENQMKITGKKEVSEDDDNRNFLHRGIAQRTFERRFSLADHIKVTGAKLEHGLLHVKLVRDVPEAKRPKPIQIETSQNKSLEN